MKGNVGLARREPGLRSDRGTQLLFVPVGFGLDGPGMRRKACSPVDFGGDLLLNTWWRKDPGHIAAMPDDRGAALRFTMGF